MIGNWKHLRKEGSINGYKLTFLMDTGSHYLIIKASVAERCQMVVGDTAKKLYRLGSTTTPSVSAVGEIRTMIKVGGVESGPVIVLVVRDQVKLPKLIV